MHTNFDDLQQEGAGPIIATVLQAMQTNVGVGDLVAQLASTYLDDSSQAQLRGVLGSRALEAPVDAEFDEVEETPTVGERTRLRDELELYQAALGICTACFDEDDNCEACNGEPVKPDMQIFMEFVMPAALDLPQAARRKMIQVLADSLYTAASGNANRG